MEMKIRQSFYDLAIFGIPCLIALLSILWGQFGREKPGDIYVYGLIVSVFAYVVVMNRGGYVTLSADSMTYVRYYFLRSHIRKVAISHSIAIAKMEMGSNKYPFRLEVYEEGAKEPTIVVNLKPFSPAAIETIFEWMPNLDRSRYRGILVDKKNQP